MTDSRKWMRFAVCLCALALLGAQPPGSTPPAPEPPRLDPAPTRELPPPVAQPSPPPLLPPGLPQAGPAQPLPGVPPRRFDLTFDRKAAPKDLLPLAPKAAPRGPVTVDDLKAIPEVDFAAAPAKDQAVDKRVNEAARQLAKINHVNSAKTDAFMATLLENRPDLTGMPFAMGDACRTKGDAVKHFTQAAQLVRSAMGGNVQTLNPPPSAAPAPITSSRSFFTPTQSGPPVSGSVTLGNFVAVQNVDTLSVVTLAVEPFWQRFNNLCDNDDAARGRTDKATAEHVTLARVAALTQMLAAESAEMRLGLVKYLAGVAHVESSRALARMAIYSAEPDVRDAAITALKVRREKDYSDVLVKGLGYPWPAVARRAADAIAKLERTDLIPQLLTALEATDPRLPVTKEKVTTVREMVKMNHHRNCVMCHAPSGSGTHNPQALTAEVAVQGQPLPSPSQGYRQETTELLIRLDVTYLRQDFSASMTVHDAHPWPEQQRFDFFVRERTLTAEEATEYVAKLTPKEEGVLSPYHKAAVSALRELTGKDAAPTAAAWRKLLGVPRGE